MGPAIGQGDVGCVEAGVPFLAFRERYAMHAAARPTSDDWIQADTGVPALTCLAIGCRLRFLFSGLI